MCKNLQKIREGKITKACVCCKFLAVIFTSCLSKPANFVNRLLLKGVLYQQKLSIEHGTDLHRHNYWCLFGPLFNKSATISFAACSCTALLVINAAGSDCSDWEA
jgi:hypothetical protein